MINSKSWFLLLLISIFSTGGWIYSHVKSKYSMHEQLVKMSEEYQEYYNNKFNNEDSSKQVKMPKLPECPSNCWEDKLNYLDFGL